MSLLVATLAGCLIVLEAVFALAVTQSEGIQLSLASRRWFERYWKPINSRGYRDLEFDPLDLQGRRTVLILGDSAAAGQGIEDADDRFSDLLREKLGPPFAVLNVAQCGWETPDELRALDGFPVVPEALVLAYSPNDILSAGVGFGLVLPSLAWLPSPEALKWIEASYFFNYLYWTVFRWRHGEAMRRDYVEHLRRCWETTPVREKHYRDLARLIEVCRDHRIRLIVLAVPLLVDEDLSAEVTQRMIADVCRPQGVEVLDMHPVFEAEPVEELVVSPADAHPNEFAHELIAERLLEALQKK